LAENILERLGVLALAVLTYPRRSFLGKALREQTAQAKAAFDA
jgi:hypothetical protein